MQVIENWATIRGSVTSIEPHPSIENYMRAVVRVAGVENDGSYPNLMKEAAGQFVDISIPAADAAALKPGTQILARVQKTGPGAQIAAAGSVRIQS